MASWSYHVLHFMNQRAESFHPSILHLHGICGKALVENDNVSVDGDIIILH